MAFQYYTIDAIRSISLADIPDSFVTYYNGLSDDMKAEIREIRPDLITAIESCAVTQEAKKNLNKADAAESTETEANFSPKTEGSAELESGDLIIEAWESIPKEKWRSASVEAPVLVCKVMPNYNRICRIHRIGLQKKNIKFKSAKGAITGADTYFCPDCTSVFIEERDVVETIRRLDGYGIPVWIQPLDQTLKEWKEQGEPNVIGEDAAIYIPKTWHEGQDTCPIHPNAHLLEDEYERSYAGKSIRFSAFYCPECDKILMRNTNAQRLEERFAERGVPAMEFKPLRRERKKAETVERVLLRPNFFVTDGEVIKYELGDQVSWTELDEQDTVVVGLSRICTEGHETEDTPGLLRVLERRGASWSNYLVILGYCEECERYYIDKADYDRLYSLGRSEVQIIDETNGDYHITSGAIFNDERDHLSTVEEELDRRIRGIQGAAGYVGKYETLSYGYDDGGLHDAKARNKENYKEIASISKHKGRPYEYRADIMLGDAAKTYYLGMDDISLDEDTSVISFRSGLGRELVNYRNFNVTVAGEKRRVKLRRDFDIANARLFGYTEQSDEDIVFRSGITDQFLIRVLNMRRKQHQLIDIISTIQENQNQIVDHPLSQSIIVQGCAGSGKTMVLLHRLSIMKYNNPDYDFSRAVILTPNSNFNTHIEGLAASLQLGYIHRVSVEEYYKELLGSYDASFKESRKIEDEMALPQQYVDYIYSKDFFSFFDSAYAEAADYLAFLCRRAEDLGVQFGAPLKLETVPDREKIPRLTAKLRLLDGIAREAENNYQRCAKQYEATEARFEFLTGKVAESEHTLQETIAEQLRRMQQELVAATHERLAEKDALEKRIDEAERESRIVQKAQYSNGTVGVEGAEAVEPNEEFRKQALESFSEELKSRPQRLLDLDENIEAAKAEYDRVSRALLIRGKRQKLADAQEKIEGLVAQREAAENHVFHAKKQQRLSLLQRRINQMLERKDTLQSEIDAIDRLKLDDIEQVGTGEAKQYINSLLPYIGDVLTPIRVISQREKIHEDYSNELAQMPELREKHKEELELAKKGRIPEDAQEALVDLQNEVGRTTAIRLYSKCLKAAEKQAESMMSERGIDAVRRKPGSEYRFDLYLQLHFARRFFRKTVGNFSLICIDEGQDLTEGEYELIRDMNGENPIFNVFGDTDQLIKRGRGISNWDQVDSVIGGAKRFQLLENYRNTNQITTYCNRAFGMNMTLTGVDGHSVKEIIRSRLEAALAELKKEEERVAIILPRCVQKGTYLDRSQLPSAIESRIGEAVGPGIISLVHVDEVKGIEFDRAFVVPNGMSRNEKYIAFTRALSDLTVVDDDEISSEEDSGGYRDGEAEA